MASSGGKEEVALELTKMILSSQEKPTEDQILEAFRLSLLVVGGMDIKLAKSMARIKSKPPAEQP